LIEFLRCEWLPQLAWMTPCDFLKFGARSVGSGTFVWRDLASGIFESGRFAALNTAIDLLIATLKA
jgi:hypothetical protein